MKNLKEELKQIEAVMEHPSDDYYDKDLHDRYEEIRKLLQLCKQEQSKK